MEVVVILIAHLYDLVLWFLVANVRTGPASDIDVLFFEVVPLDLAIDLVNRRILRPFLALALISEIIIFLDKILIIIDRFRDFLFLLVQSFLRINIVQRLQCVLVQFYFLSIVLLSGKHQLILFCK